MTSHIPDKETFNRLSQAGKLGNYLRTFDSYTKAVCSGVEWFTIRGHVKAFKHFVPVVHQRYLADATWELSDKGVKPYEYYFQEIPPPSVRRVIQFEAMLGPQWSGAGIGVELFYELDTLAPVRGIRDRCLTASGIKSQALLRHKLDPRSYDSLMEIWDTYPTAIIEASEFSKPVGAFDENLCVWEVRDF